MINKRVTFNICSDLHNKIKDYASNDYRTVGNTINRILELGLETILIKDKTYMANIENISIATATIDTATIDTATNIETPTMDTATSSDKDVSFIKINIESSFYTKLCELNHSEKQTIKEKLKLFLELEYNNLAIDNGDIVTELPLRVNIKLDQLKKFNDMAKIENLPINKLMSVILNQYIKHYYCSKRKLCNEDIETFRKHAVDKIVINQDTSIYKLFFNNN